MNYEKLTREELIRELRSRDGRDSETLEAILDAAADGILVVDENSKVIHLNNRFLEIWGIPDSLKHEQEEWILAAYCKNNLISPDEFIPNMKIISEHGVDYNDYLHFKDNRVVLRLFRPLKLNGNIVGKVWIYRDITKNILLKREIAKNENLYRRLIDLLPEAIFVYKSGKLAITNQAGLRIADYKNETELIGRDFGTVTKTPLEYLDRVAEIRRTLTNTEATLDFVDQKIELANGNIREVEVAAFSFTQEDEHYITTIVRDLTEKKAIKTLEKKVSENTKLLELSRRNNKLKSQVFSSISHELKTPLNIIFGSVQMLEKIHEGNVICGNSVALSKYLKLMRQNCYRLLRLINNFIDVNKIEVGFFKLELKNRDIVKIVEDITLSVVDYTNNRGIELIFDTDVEEKFLACDAEKLERVVLNLLSNAIKFTSPGGSISVNIYDKEEDILISVKDSGTGIPTNMLSKIFEPFNQVDGSLRRNAEGNGIGLSIVKSLVEMHGGSISVNSTLGVGSEFIIKLPVRLVSGDLELNIEENSFTDSKIERIDVEFSDIYA